MQSQNIIFTGPQQAEIASEEIPTVPADGLLVRSRMSLISTGTECICFRGEFQPGSHWANWVRYPFHPGYSNVGIIEAVGRNVEGYAVGDRVFSTANHRQLHVVTPPVMKIPDGVGDEEAIWSKLATITQTGVRRAELTMGATVVVIGLGPLGQLVTQYVRLMGAQEVLAVDMVASRLEIAQAHGATQLFNGSAADALPFVLEHSHGQRADVVFDATGHFAVLPLALNLVRNHGTLLLIGDSPHPGRQVLTGDVLTRQVQIRGTHNEKLADDREWTAMRQMELFYRYLERGQMRVADLITGAYSPMDAPDVYTKLLTDRAATIGTAFDWTRV